MAGWTPGIYQGVTTRATTNEGAGGHREDGREAEQIAVERFRKLHNAGEGNITNSGVGTGG